MSLDFVSERVCYVNCNFCNTILAVSVPCSNLFTIVTVRCGHCANLLSVNMGASLQIFPTNPDSSQTEKMEIMKSEESGSSSKSKSKCNNIKLTPFESSDTEPPRMPPIRPPEKRQRVPSAYNKFIKEEIQRIKASNPDITHREAFSTAAKNWAHFPHIHFGLKMEGNKHGKLEQSFGAETTKKANGYYDIN